MFAFLLFMANKSNSSFGFLGESTTRQSAFEIKLTLGQLELIPKQHPICFLILSDLYEAGSILSFKHSKNEERYQKQIKLTYILVRRNTKYYLKIFAMSTILFSVV